MIETEARNHGAPADAKPDRRGRGLSRAALIQYSVLICTSLFVLGPLIPVLFQSLIEDPIYAYNFDLVLTNFSDLFTDPEFIGVVGTTLLFGVLATVLSLIIGAGLAVVTVRMNIFGARAVRLISIWPIFISPMVLAFGSVFAYGPAGYLTVWLRTLGIQAPWDLYTIPGMAFTSAIAFSPIAFVYCSAALELADASLEGAARVSGLGRLAVVWRVVLPPLRPAMLYSGLLLLVLALEEVTIPLIYGSPRGIETIGSYLYIHGIREGVDGTTGAVAVILLAMCVVLLSLQTVLLRNSSRFISVRGKASRHQPLDLGRAKILISIIVWVYLFFGPILPGVMLLARAFTKILTPLVPPLPTIENFSVVWSSPMFLRAIGNSVMIATAGAILTTLVAVLAVLVARRSRFRFRRFVEFTALSPQAIPGVVLGFGLFWFFVLVPFLSPVRTTLVGIGLAFLIALLPQAFGAIAPVASQIGGELDDAARTSGADWWYTMWRVIVPIFRPAVLASMTLVFASMMKGVTPALFLVTADTQIIGTTTLQLWINGNTGSVAALSVIQVAITLLFVAIATRIFKVKVYA